MENVTIVASSKKFKDLGVFFQGIKTFSVIDDVVTIEMNDGRKFSSPIDQLRGTYHSVLGYYLIKYIWKRRYQLYNPQGETLVLNYSDFDGFKGMSGGGRKPIYDILDSSPFVKPTGAEKFRKVLAWINWLFWTILLICCFFVGGNGEESTEEQSAESTLTSRIEACYTDDVPNNKIMLIINNAI